MPALTLEIPRSAWDNLEKVARREGVKSVRTLLIHRIADLATEGEALEPEPAATPEQALA
jgi:hypothetical protein